MGRDRPKGRTVPTEAGRDDLAGRTMRPARRRGAGGQGARSGSADQPSGADEAGLESAETPPEQPASPDESELDARERRQSRTRKPPGPSRERAADAEPTAPPEDAPAPTDPL